MFQCFSKAAALVCQSALVIVFYPRFVFSICHFIYFLQLLSISFQLLWQVTQCKKYNVADWLTVTLESMILEFGLW